VPSYVIDEKGVVANLDEKLSDPGALLSQILCDPRFRPGMRVLIDARALVDVGSRTAMDTALTRVSPQQRNLGGLGLLVADDVHYGVSRQFAVFAEMYGIAVHIFRDDARAQRCLRGGGPPF
jgi:hypothetical protein